MRTINKSHFALWGNFIEWIDKERLMLTGEMRVNPEIGDKLIDGVDEYKFIVVNECENKTVFFATAEES